MTIKDWPENERPREKLLLQGAHTLSDAELLAIFIRCGRKGKTAVDIARDCLKDFQGLRGLLAANLPSFHSYPGLGASQYVALQASQELMSRQLEASLKTLNVLSNTTQTQNFLKAKLRDHTNEKFACIFLDSRNHMLSFEVICEGTFNLAPVYPREVVKRALACNAASVIFAHNHPQGAARPSDEDRTLTEVLKNILESVEVRVLDHVIVGVDDVYSFAATNNW